VKATGAKAGIVDGLVTDLEEVEANGFPLWARGLSSVTTRLYDLGGRMNLPVPIGGVVVSPGDVVLADESGVLILPVHEAETEARRALSVQEGVAARLESVATGQATLGSLSGATAKVEAGMV
jgi:regulator of RNase E activity RraA